jgi:hypothetical protein
MKKLGYSNWAQGVREVSFVEVESHRVLSGRGLATVQVPLLGESATDFRSKILDT